MRPGRRYFGTLHCDCGTRANVAAVCDCVVIHMHRAQITGGENVGARETRIPKRARFILLPDGDLDFFFFFEKAVRK